MQSSLFEPGCPVLVVVCVARKLRPCPSYSRRRDRIHLGLWRSLYIRGGGDQTALPLCHHSTTPHTSPMPTAVKFFCFGRLSLWPRPRTEHGVLPPPFRRRRPLVCLPHMPAPYCIGSLAAPLCLGPMPANNMPVGARLLARLGLFATFTLRDSDFALCGTETALMPCGHCPLSIRHTGSSHHHTGASLFKPLGGP